MKRQQQKLSKAAAAVRCPACELALPSLDRLDFHLNFACLSRKREKLDDEEEEVMVKEEDDAMIVCPVCTKVVKRDDLNFHLDHNCTKPSVTSTSPLPSTGSNKPPGLIVIENFVSPEEEAELAAALNARRWKPTTRNGKGGYMHWGTVIDYSGTRPTIRHPNPKLGEEPIPDFLQVIITRFQSHAATNAETAAWRPNNCNAQQYIKSRGDHLTAHYDDRKLSGTIVCNISLLSDCTMTFRKAQTEYKVKLPRLSASVMTRSSRYDYTHEITLEDFEGEERISLNFRQQLVS